MIQKSAPITVSVKSEKQIYASKDSILISISVLNSGANPVVLPISLDMGYESSLNRNFYLQVKDSLSHILSGKDEISDYDRIYTLPADQRKKTVLPGEKITAEVHLNEWYHLKPGIYQIRMAFDPEKQETDLQKENLPVFSNWISIEIWK